MTSLNGQKIQIRMTELIFGICLLAFASIIVSPNFSNKLLNVAGFIAFFLVAYNIKNIRKSETFWLCMILLVTGICDLIWYGLYKVDNSDAINSYRAYLEVGKICIYGAFLILAFSTAEKFKIGNNRIHYAIIIILQTMMIAYSCYQYMQPGHPRVEFSLGGGTSATGAAYTVVFLSCYIMMVLQHSRMRFKDLLILAHFFVTFIILVTTGTRAAIIVYPAIFAGLLCIRCYMQRHIPWKGIAVLMLAFMAGSFMMKDNLVKRYNDLNRDVSAYEKDNSNTSVGARFAMWKSGLIASEHNYLWQSTDQRNALIRQAVKEDPSLSGALIHIKGHLHNEIVEAASTKGPSGVLLYLAFVIALAWYSLCKIKSFALLSFLGAMMMFGFGGVMFYSKTTPTAWMLTLIMFIVFLTQNRHRDVVK
ncbi:MAG TPA: O-antigen ligase family protein [Scandinavium sp.]|jgi:O-antigen ligase